MSETPPDHDTHSLDELTAAERERVLAKARDNGATDLHSLQASSAADLLEVATREGVEVMPNLDKAELVFAILQHRFERSGLGWAEGVLEVLPDGFGFLRSARHDFEPGPDDIYVSPSQVRRLNLKPGHRLAGPVRPPRRGEKYFALLHVDAINDGDVAALRQRVPFTARTPVLPTARLRLDHAEASLALRAVDLLAPWGRGQRVLIAAPPGSGRTSLLEELAIALRTNHDDLHVLMCLLDERPEELTAIRRRQQDCPGHGDVVATTFEQPAARHIALAEMTLARAQRMVEAGKDVVLLFDSLTAYVRALHVDQPPTGKLVCVGLDAGAVLRPKRLFGAARNCEEGGSLTIIATALAEDDSRVDAAILEEFQNRGNCDVVLDRALADQHITPALDVLRTGTRREDMLLPAERIDTLRRLRERLAPLEPRERLAEVVRLLQSTPTNDELLTQL
ncbi:MAG: transcription termination factor Rho [bacterium]|nr:transcription termination factor Rho [bacterium]